MKKVECRVDEKFYGIGFSRLEKKSVRYSVSQPKLCKIFQFAGQFSYARQIIDSRKIMRLT